MKVGLIDVDRFTFPRMKFPNLALMKISGWHKEHGDSVEFCTDPMTPYDIVYQSKVFDETYSPDIDWYPNAKKVIKGGTGYDLHSKLPDKIEHQYPDYHLYDGTPAECRDVAYGYMTRGCPRSCPWCIVGEKEGTKAHKVADLREFWKGQKKIVLLDPNLLAARHSWKDCMGQLLIACDRYGSRVDFTQGLDARLCDWETVCWLNGLTVERIHFAWDDPKQDLTPHFELLNKHMMMKDPRRRIVYVLANYNSTPEEDLHRIYTVESLGFDADLRVYDRPNAPKEVLRMQRWCNNRFIHGACKRFEDYKG